MGKISSYTDLGTAPADDDWLVVHDEDNKTYKLSYANLKAYADLNHSPVQVQSTNLTAEQIATLFDSSIVVLDAPPSGYFNILLNAVVYYNYGTAAYTDRQLVIRHFTQVITNASTFENSGNDSVLTLAPISCEYWTLTLVGFNLKALVGNPGETGDGVMEVQVTYKTIKL